MTISSGRFCIRQPPRTLTGDGPAMRGLGELAELAAEIFADRLHAETDAEDRQFFLERRINRRGNPEVLGTARPRRQHQQVPGALLQHVERMDMTDHDDIGADLAEIIRQHVYKAVVMVDQQHLLAAAGGVGREGRQRLRRIAAQGLEQRGRLDLALAIFGRGVGIEQAGRADPNLGEAILHPDGADGQARY